MVSFSFSLLRKYLGIMLISSPGKIPSSQLLVTALYIQVSPCLNWVFLQVPSSQKKQLNQTMEFSWGLYCLAVLFFVVVCNLCLSTYRQNPSVLKQKLPYEDDFLLYHFHYFATYYNMFDKILK